MFGSVRFIPHLILKEGWAANGGMECGSPTGDVDLVNCHTEIS